MTPNKHNSSKNDPWWKSLLALASQSLMIETLSITRSVKRQIQAFIQITTIRFFLFLFGFLGLIFIFVGLSRFLNNFFHVPGVAELLLGATILSLSLIFFFLLKNKEGN